MHLRLAFALLLPWFLLGCTPFGSGLGITDPEREKIATTYIDYLRDGRSDLIVADLAPGIRQQGNPEMFAKMQALIPSGSPTVRELIGYQRHSANSNPPSFNLSYQYGFDGKWVAINVAFREAAPGRIEIFGMRVYPLAASLQESHRFTFVGKSWIHYAFLACCLGIAVFTVGTLVACARTPIRRRKWLWIVFVLLGFVQFSLDWTTGTWGAQPLTLQLLGGGALRATPYSPWIVSFSLPVGAVVFWLRRRHLTGALPPALPTAGPPPVGL